MSYNKTDSLKLCDYVTLLLSDATTTTNNSYTWNIQGGGYYSDRRSQTCTVEVSSGIVDSTILGTGLLVQYGGGGSNHYTSTRGKPIIGMSGVISSYDAVNTNVTYSINSTGTLLCQPRPGEITLQITNTSNVEVSTVLEGAITLKYTYYNSIASAEKLQSEYTPTEI